MLVKEPKYRKQLSDNQKLLLGLLYGFRFSSLDLLAEHLGKNRSTIYESLFVLEAQGYITKLYNKSYRLRGRPAIYTLAHAGINYLAKTGQYDQKHLRNFYKNRKAEEELIDRHLVTYKVYLALRRRFGKNYQVLNRYSLIREEFIEPLPDLFLKTDSDKPDYIVDIIEAGTLSWLLRRRVRAHQEADDESDYRYPNVLFIAGDVNTERRLFRMTYENYYDLEFYITQLEMLIGEEHEIWTDADNSDEDEIVRKPLGL